MHVDDVPPFNLAIEDPHLSGVKRLHDLEQTIEFRKSSAGIGFRVHSVTCSTSHACCKQGERCCAVVMCINLKSSQEPEGGFMKIIYANNRNCLNSLRNELPKL